MALQLWQIRWTNLHKVHVCGIPLLVLMDSSTILVILIIDNLAQYPGVVCSSIHQSSKNICQSRQNQWQRRIWISLIPTLGWSSAIRTPGTHRHLKQTSLMNIHRQPWNIVHKTSTWCIIHYNTKTCLASSIVITSEDTSPEHVPTLTLYVCGYTQNTTTHWGLTT